eukprot:TRINITY_DN3429_c0_g2_i1.p1 TRINITY_DN3429_c0_g2~~TRINITY_DN3429_c0_g2_i1.p1  ORF type:complete len:567 (-),score=107.55 TRINITY_DN3429_c0_g2_i1:35-1735(-)
MRSTVLAVATALAWSTVSASRTNYSSPLGSISYTSSALLDFVDYTALPGSAYILDNLTFNSFAGYIDINETSGKKYFYYFVESQGNPASDPLALWTNGGPGCSGLSALFVEHGPFTMDNVSNLVFNPFSWNQFASIIYIEQPTGVGFSYSNDYADYSTGDAQAAKDMYTFIQNWLAKFPSYRSNDFYLTSESYGGHYMPTTALEIVTQQAANTNSSLHLNFKGFMVGNPLTDSLNNNIVMLRKLWRDSFLPIDLYSAWENGGCADLNYYFNDTCTALTNQLTSIASGPYDAHGLDLPICSNGYSVPDTYEQRRQLLQMIANSGINPVVAYEPCNVRNAYKSNLDYVHSASFKTAVHARSDIVWTACNSSLNYNHTDILTPTQGYYNKLVNLTNGSLKILVFSGDMDSVVPTEGTQDWIFYLGYDPLVFWKEWVVDGQTAGFITKFNRNITFATVRDAGHAVPAAQPVRSLILFQSYLNGSLHDQKAVSAPASTSAPTSSASSSSSSAAISTTTFNGMVFIIICLILSAGYWAARVAKLKKQLEELESEKKHTSGKLSTVEDKHVSL